MVKPQDQNFWGRLVKSVEIAKVVLTSISQWYLVQFLAGRLDPH